MIRNKSEVENIYYNSSWIHFIIVQIINKIKGRKAS
jgi:hypothetical protein